MESDDLILQQALKYAEMGFKVVPNAQGKNGVCSCFRKKECETVGKHPTIKEWTQNASSNKDTIRGWHRKGLLKNVGLLTGKNGGFIVIDVDQDESRGKFGKETLEYLETVYGRLPDTVEQITGSGGRHLLFKVPDHFMKNSASELGDNIDIRGEGGQIIVYPSIHPNGTMYEWEVSSVLGEVDIVELPEKWVQFLCGKKSGTSGNRLELPDIISEGLRDITFFKTACSMRSRGHTEEEVLATLTEMNNRTKPPLTQKEIEAKIKSAFKYDGNKKIVDQTTENFIFNEKFCNVRHNEKTNKKTIKVKPMQENVFSIMDHYQTTARYNEMTKEIEVSIEGESFSADNSNELSLRYIHNKCIHHDFNAPIDLVQSSFLSQGEMNKYNPAKAYLEKQYEVYQNANLSDLSEFQKLLDTLKTPDTFNLEYKERLIKKWLISCVVAVCGEKGIKSQGVLVLQGKQGLMKTTWLKKLIPNENWFNEGESLDPANKDSVLGSIKYWVVELGEIESTFKKDLERLKAFISKDFDEVRRPYARTTSKYPRRTIFCGSVNGDEFLKDPTGNRRWWVIPCEDIVFNETFDLNKLWAEMYQLYLNGSSYYLSKQQIEEMSDINAQFEVKDKTYTLIQCSFDWDSHQRYWLKTVDIFNMLNDTKGITPTSINHALKKLKVPWRTSSGREQFAMPKAINVYEWRYKQAPDDISVIFN
jgi:predicted P-loop ATPase